MSRDPLPLSDSVAESSVMAAVDEDGGGKRLVIADVARDESWLSAPLDFAASLADWR